MESGDQLSRKRELESQKDTDMTDNTAIIIILR